jgi:hypothetical protein
VSLLERLGRHHLGDRDFARIWTDGTGHPHLDTCAACRTRFDAYGGWLDGVGEELRDDADRVFTSDRLATQQAHIARRLEGLDRPARVIAFPRAARAIISGRSHVRRWVTVAAAAAFVAGIGLGQFIDHSFDRTDPGSVTEFTSVAATHRASGIRPISLSETDEEFLNEAEAVGPRVKELRAIDDLTPHVRDYVPRK